MTMLKAEEYQSNIKEVAGYKINVTSYKIGDQFHCHIDNVSPGATIARSTASTRDGAIQSALEKAQERLGEGRK